MPTSKRDAALRAWRTMRGPLWKARRTANLSKAALERFRPKSPDQVEVYLVQLKAGGSGFKAAEMARLTKAAAAVKAQPLIILHDGDQLHFLGGEPSFTGAKQGRAGA